MTLIANYQPLQAPYGGPNYFLMDPNALYEIHIDNDGDNREDITFQFKFNNNRKNVDAGHRRHSKVAIPLVQAGQVADRNAAALNVNETFTVDVVRGSRRQKTNGASKLTNVSGGGSMFDKPVDNIGTKTIPDYTAYADKHIYEVNIPGCSQPGQLFVGQRKEPFAVNLGTIFDLVNAPVSFIANRANAGAVAQHHRRRQHHHARARSAQELPDQGQRPGDRRLDHGQHCAKARLSFDKPVRSGSSSSPTTSVVRGRRCRAWACRWSTKW